MSESLGELIRLACQAEVLARKPGNVHPGAPFSDLDVRDFLIAADAIAPVLAQPGDPGVGRTVYESVLATRTRIATNANLGICLLLAPCAAAADANTDFRASLQRILDVLTIEDARRVYDAIRLAAPGGLGTAAEEDVAAEPTVTLLDAMRLAAHRDGVARQYATGFQDVFEIGLPAIERFAADGPETSIIAAHLHLMASRPDTLILRKCGPHIAEESAVRAARVLEHGWPAAGRNELVALDRWLRADGHRRNPGTTADLVAATVFVALRERRLDPQAVQQWCQSVQIQLTASSGTPGPPASRPHPDR